MSDIIAVCLIEVPEGEQLANDYPGYQYRQNLQMPPGSHPVYTADALRAKDAEIERLTAERDALKKTLGVVQEALRLVAPYTDSLLCYASTVEEHPPNKIDSIVHDALIAVDAAMGGSDEAL